MKELDYNELTGEIADHLEKSINIVLATCADGIVTGRTMNHINDGLNVIFSTSAGSEKTSQIRANKNVALVCGPLQIQAVAEFCGTLAGNEAYSEKYYKKFPWLVNAFPSDPKREITAFWLYAAQRTFAFISIWTGTLIGISWTSRIIRHIGFRKVQSRLTYESDSVALSGRGAGQLLRAALFSLPIQIFVYSFFILCLVF